MRDRERIALCLIAGENVIEEGYERMLRSVVGEIDGVFISYNGPIPDRFDGSVLQKLQSLTTEIVGEVPGLIAPIPWSRDFSVARNHSFSLINYDESRHGRFDWILWLDVDDIIPDGIGIQEVIEIANEKRAHGVLLNYEYHYDEERRIPLVSHYKERLFRADVDWVWVNPIHENCVGPIATPMIRVEGQAIRHLRKNAEPKRERNREIVSRWYQDNRNEPRAIMYFAHETVALAEETESAQERTVLYGTAYRLYREYLEKAPPTDDSYLCNRQAAYCLQQLGKFNDSINIDLQGIKMQPLWPASYLGIAETYYRMGQYQMAIDWADRVPEGVPDTTQGVQHLESIYKALMIKGHAAFDLGNYNLSVASFIGAKKIYSDDFVERMITKARAQQTRSIQPIRSVRSSLWGTGDGHTIAFFVPPGAEEWDRDLINERGSGGTELSVLRLAENFAEHGWRTVIFGRPSEDVENTLDHRGIEWYDTSRYHPDEPFDVFVVLRMPQMLDARINARQIILWLHDVNVGDVRYGEYGDRFARVHHIIVPSPFHYDHLMRVYGQNDDILRNRLSYIPNGLDREAFISTGGPRDNNQIVYASSPDRGLLRLLELWPLMQNVWDPRLESGQPKLKIFYGWESIDASIAADTPQAPLLINFRNRVMNRIAELQDDFEAVEMIGRVRQSILADEFKKSELMLYPANFMETFGIVFAQAMTAGTIPLVPNLGALPWVVNYPSLIVPGAPESEIFARMFLQKIRELRNLSEPARRMIRRELRTNTEVFDWERVASTWINMISEHNRLEAA